MYFLLVVNIYLFFVVIYSLLLSILCCYLFFVVINQMEVKEEEYFMNNYRAIRFGSKKSFEKLRQVPDLLA